MDASKLPGAVAELVYRQTTKISTVTHSVPLFTCSNKRTWLCDQRKLNKGTRSRLPRGFDAPAAGTGTRTREYGDRDPSSGINDQYTISTPILAYACDLQ